MKERYLAASALSCSSVNQLIGRVLAVLCMR